MTFVSIHLSVDARCRSVISMSTRKRRSSTTATRSASNSTLGGSRTGEATNVAKTRTVQVSVHECTDDAIASRVFLVIDALGATGDLDREAAIVDLLEHLCKADGRAYVIARSGTSYNWDRRIHVIEETCESPVLGNMEVTFYSGKVEAHWAVSRSAMRNIKGGSCTCPYFLVVVARHETFATAISYVLTKDGIEHVIYQNPRDACQFFEQMNNNSVHVPYSQLGGASSAAMELHHTPCEPTRVPVETAIDP
jgi:hypothetical protein